MLTTYLMKLLTDILLRIMEQRFSDGSKNLLKSVTSKIITWKLLPIKN